METSSQGTNVYQQQQQPQKTNAAAIEPPQNNRNYYNTTAANSQRYNEPQTYDNYYSVYDDDADLYRDVGKSVTTIKLCMSPKLSRFNQLHCLTRV